jgi:hypothetical protein
MLQLRFTLEKLFPQEFLPGTAEGAAQSEKRRQRHVDCTGFELLHGSQFEVNSLRQLCLGHGDARPDAAHIGTEMGQERLLLFGQHSGSVSDPGSGENELTVRKMRTNSSFSPGALWGGNCRLECGFRDICDQIMRANFAEKRR